MSWYRTVPLSLLACFAGCSTTPRGQYQATTPHRFEASPLYPGNPIISPRVRAIAIDHPAANRLRIYNPSARAIPPSVLWVNGAFSREMPSIPARSGVAVPYASVTQPLAIAVTPDATPGAAVIIELQVGNRLYHLTRTLDGDSADAEGLADAGTDG